MTSDSPSGRIKLPEIVHSKWDEMLGAYNPIITRINQMKREGSTALKTSSDRNVELNEFASRISSSIYKLYWASKSLEYLMEFNEKHAKTMESAENSMFEPVPDAFIFHADVFFSFAS